MKGYKKFIAKVKSDGKTCTLKMSCKDKDEAWNLTGAVYKGWLRTKLISSFEILEVYQVKGGN